MRGDWPGKKIHKPCFELLSFCSSGDRINFTCWLSATDRSGTKCKSCSGALETSLGFHTAQTPSISPVTIALPIFSFIRVFRKHLALWRWRVRSEERRVGKEWRSWWSSEHCIKKESRC